MIVFIDNYDSFTYNLVDYIGQFTTELQVFRNDVVSIAEIAALEPRGIVISPGPGTPDDAGISNKVIDTFASHTPILGVCLGHQCIGQVFGAKVIRAPEPVHGKASPIFHNNHSLFSYMPIPFLAGRYHSLIIDRQSLPNDFEVIAWTADDIIMGIQHRQFPLTGVQFHPESVLTPQGKQLIANWLATVGIIPPTQLTSNHQIHQVETLIQPYTEGNRR